MRTIVAISALILFTFCSSTTENNVADEESDKPSTTDQEQVEKKSEVVPQEVRDMNARFQDLSRFFKYDTRLVDIENSVFKAESSSSGHSVEWYDISLVNRNEGDILIWAEVSYVDVENPHIKVYMTIFSHDASKTKRFQIADNEKGINSVVTSDKVLQVSIRDHGEGLFPSFRTFTIDDQNRVEEQTEFTNPASLELLKAALREFNENRMARPTDRGQIDYLAIGETETDGDGMLGINYTCIYTGGSLLVNKSYSFASYSRADTSFYLANGDLKKIEFSSRENQIMMDPISHTQSEAEIELEDGSIISSRFKSLEMELAEGQEESDFNTAFEKLEFGDMYDLNLAALRKYMKRIKISACTPIMYNW